MSQGKQRLILRVDDETVAAIRAEIEKQNEGRTDAPYDMSSWVRQAIAERLAKLTRGRRSRKGGK